MNAQLALAADLPVDALPQGFAEFTSDGDLRRVNRRLEKLLALPHPPPADALWTQLAGAEDTARLHQALTQADPPAPVIVAVRAAEAQLRWLRFDWLEESPFISGRAALVTDVSEQRAQAARLQELERIEQRYRAIWEHNVEAVFILDEQGRYLERNAVAVEMTGYGIDELQGLAFLDRVVPEDRPRLDSAFTNALQGQPQHYQYQLIARDQRLLTFDAVLVPLRVDGQVRELISLSRDITERRKLQDGLQRSKELLDLFFTQSLDGFFFMMLDEPIRWDESIDKEAMLDHIFTHQRLTRANQALLDQYGLRKSQMLGRTPRNFFAHDLDGARLIWRRLFDQGRLHRQSDERRADGAQIWIEGDYVCLYDSQGRITGHFGIQRDITQQVEAKRQLQESEAKYRSLFERSLDGIILFVEEPGAHDSRLIAANPAACRILGRSEAELIQGGWPLIFPGEIEGQESRLELSPGEYLYRRSDGQRVPVEGTTSGFPGAGRRWYYSVTFRDISKRKQGEAELKRSRDDVRRLWSLLQSVREEEQQRLALELQDELGQILAVIKLDVGWIRGHLPQETPQLQNKLEDTEVMLDSALDSIRRLSRQLRPRALDDIGLVGACEALLSEFEKQYGLQTKLRASHAEFALETALKTSIFRIVQQALSVSRHGRASRVQVELLQGQDSLTIHIADDGRGFLPKAAENSDAAGLTEIRERVRLLDGQLDLIAQPGGGGAKLRITLQLGQNTPPLKPLASSH
jgi:PAS domain S-box-containing protein